MRKVHLSLAVLLGLVVAINPTGAQMGNPCPGTCTGKWLIDTHWKNGDNHNAAGNTDWTTDNVDVNTPAKQTAKWRNTGGKGSENLDVVVEDPLPTPPLFNVNSGLASISKTADSYKQWVIRWDAGNATVARCAHGRPDGGANPASEDKGTCTWGGGGSATAECGGRADNGQAAVAGVSSAGAEASLTFSGLESKAAVANVSGSRTESAANTTGSVTLSPNPTGVLSFTINSDVWSSGAKVATVSVSGSYGSANPPTVPTAPDINGKFLKAYAIVVCQATIDNGAEKAYASASTTIGGTTTLSAMGGIHSTCCNGQKNHGGHTGGTGQDIAD